MYNKIYLKWTILWNCRPVFVNRLMNQSTGVVWFVAWDNIFVFLLYLVYICFDSLHWYCRLGVWDRINICCYLYTCHNLLFRILHEDLNSFLMAITRQKKNDLFTFHRRVYYHGSSFLDTQCNVCWLLLDFIFWRRLIHMLQNANILHPQNVLNLLVRNVYNSRSSQRWIFRTWFSEILHRVVW
jgi:hypothetical protein